MTTPPLDKPPRDHSPFVIGVFTLVAVALLVAFIVLYGGDLLSFIVMIRSWMNGGGPHL